MIAEAHEQPILCVAYNAQRREIFTGSQDTTIKAWLSETGELLRTQREHAGWVTGLTYAYLKEARTSVLFSCSVDGRILVWQKGELLQKEKVGDKATHGVQSGPLYCLEWDARRQNLVAGANGHIWVYTVVADSMNLAGQPIIKFHSLLRDAHSALQGEEPVRGQRPATCTPSTRTEWLGRLCLSSHPSPPLSTATLALALSSTLAIACRRCAASSAPTPVSSSASATTARSVSGTPTTWRTRGTGPARGRPRPRARRRRARLRRPSRLSAGRATRSGRSAGTTSATTAPSRR